MSKKVATIGFFDGVHKGHRFLIRQLLDSAIEKDAESMVVTMSPHPRSVLQPGFQPMLLTSLEEKVNLLHNAGIEHVEVLPFTRELSALTAKAFMENILSKQLQISTLIMGYDHRFGHGGGTFEEYMAWGKETGIEVVLAKQFPNEHVSSSAIRKLLAAGDVEKASVMLNRPYELCGRVVDGYKVGRTLGFPTANLQADGDRLVPGSGVYAVWVELPDGKRFKGMLNIGRRPTLANGDGVSIEVHLLHFSGDLYNLSLKVFFMNKLREECRFGSLEELKAQLQQDALCAEQLLG